MLFISNMKTTCGEWQREYLYVTSLITVPAIVKAAIPAICTQMENYLDLYNCKGIWPERATNPIEIQWGGEKVYYAGTDNSAHNGTLEFYDDEKSIVRTFWNSMKDLTGESENQVAQTKLASTFDIGVARVDVTKSKITAYRILKDCQVFKVSETDPDKSGSKENHIKVDINWDKNIPNKNMVGKTI